MITIDFEIKLLPGPNGWRWDEARCEAVEYDNGVIYKIVSGDLLYLKDGICDPHWLRQLRKKLGIK